jgi:hypothetical protein
MLAHIALPAPSNSLSTVGHAPLSSETTNSPAASYLNARFGSPTALQATWPPCLLLMVKPPKPRESRRSGSHGRIPPDSGHAGHRGGMAAHSHERSSKRSQKRHFCDRAESAFAAAGRRLRCRHKQIVMLFTFASPQSLPRFTRLHSAWCPIGDINVLSQPNRSWHVDDPCANPSKLALCQRDASPTHPAWLGPSARFGTERHLVKGSGHEWVQGKDPCRVGSRRLG